MSEEIDPGEDLSEYLAWKALRDEDRRKRGDYWLSEEGIAEIREIWGFDAEDETSPVVPLLNEVERLKAECEAARAEAEEMRKVRKRAAEPIYLLAADVVLKQKERDEARSEAERLRKERDALLEWASRFGAKVEVDLSDNGPRVIGFKAPSMSGPGYVFASTSESAVRKAAGLEPSGIPDEPSEGHEDQ